MIDWLNANDGAVTAIATVVLTLLTAVYIVQNAIVIGAMREQLDLALRIHEQERRDLEESEYRSAVAVRALANRLLATLSELPFPEPQFDRLHQAALWSTDDLNELERLARAAKIGVYAAADAVRNLNGISELVGRAKSVNPRTGMGFGERDRERWKRDIAGASHSLTQIIGTARAEIAGANVAGSAG